MTNKEQGLGSNEEAYQNALNEYQMLKMKRQLILMLIRLKTNEKLLITIKIY